MEPKDFIYSVLLAFILGWFFGGIVAVAMNQPKEVVPMALTIAVMVTVLTVMAWGVYYWISPFLP